MTMILRSPVYSNQPHSQSLPLELPEVIPFRYCEITLSSNDIHINKITQKALYYLIDWEASSFHARTRI